MSRKNENPRVISGSDARIEGQIQVEDSLVLDPIPGGSGDPIIVTASDDSVCVNGSTVPVLGEDGKLPAQALPPIGLDRQTLTQTVTIPAGEEASVELPLAKQFGLWELTTDKAARIRLYSTSADRTADSSRAEGVMPTAGVGLITEVITSASLLSVPLTPAQFGASLESTPSASISALIKNKAATNDVTITLTWTALD